MPKKAWPNSYKMGQDFLDRHDFVSSKNKFSSSLNAHSITVRNDSVF